MLMKFHIRIKVTEEDEKIPETHLYLFPVTPHPECDFGGILVQGKVNALCYA